MSKVLTALPVGERVGIAFSGGLDTSVAVAWMRAKGAVPCTYTADIGQYDEPDIDGVPARAMQYGAEIARAVDCRRELVEEGLAAMACGAFHVRSGGRTYFNTTPLGRAVTGTMLVRAMQLGRRAHLGRRLDVQGQRHRAVLPLRAAGQPAAAHLQALAGRCVRARAGRAGRDEPVAGRAQPALPRQQGEGVLHRRQHLGRHPRGQDPGAPGRLAGDGRTDHGRQVLGRRPSRSTAEDVTVRFDDGRPVAINGVDLRRPGRPGARGEHRSAGGTGWACPTRSRTGSSRPSPAGSTRRPAWPCSGSPTSGCSTRSTTRTPSPTTTPRAAGSGRLLYEGRWFDPQSLMLRESIERWVASLVTGEVTLRLRRGEDYTVLDTRGPALSYHPDKLSMERTENAAFGPVDRIGQLTMRNLDIADSRAKLERYAGKSELLTGRTQLFGELASAGLAEHGADQISANPRGAPTRSPTRPCWTARRWSPALTDPDRAPGLALWGGRFAGGPAAGVGRAVAVDPLRLAPGPLRPAPGRGRTPACCTRPDCSTTPNWPACSPAWTRSPPTWPAADSRPCPRTRTSTPRSNAG